MNKNLILLVTNHMYCAMIQLWTLVSLGNTQFPCSLESHWQIPAWCLSCHKQNHWVWWSGRKRSQFHCLLAEDGSFCHQANNSLCTFVWWIILYRYSLTFDLLDFATFVYLLNIVWIQCMQKVAKVKAYHNHITTKISIYSFPRSSVLTNTHQ